MTTAHSTRTGKDPIDDVRYRARILLLLEAAERASLTPISALRLHAFAYLADVLSPLWELMPFDGKILKSDSGPHYPDIQRQIDSLVVLGLVEVNNLRYVERPNNGARIDGLYALKFSAPELGPILGALGADPAAVPLDPRDRQLHGFLVELAGALASLSDEDLDSVANVDATYGDSRVAQYNIVDFGSWSTDPDVDNLSILTAERFRSFLPAGASLSPGEMIHLYASYLGRRLREH